MKLKNIISPLLISLLLSQTKKSFCQQLYGMTAYGGVNDLGVIFEYDAGSNSHTKKFDFDGLNGSYSYGSLIIGSNAKLIGMCWGGGVNGEGTVFEYDQTLNIFSKKIDLVGSTGKWPYGNLCLATDGNYYGLTRTGGSSVDNNGVLFKYDPVTGAYSKKIDFVPSIGINPRGSLIQASNGKLYGLLQQGAANGEGALFEYDINTNSCIVKYNFGTVNGSEPLGSLIQANNGKLYGMTQHGGANNLGVLFEYDINTNTYIKKIDFSYSIGAAPEGSLIQANNGKLYGLTALGGINNSGTLFEYDPLNNVHTKKIDLIPSTGKLPQGTLMQASNGKLYGITTYGGTNDLGVLFEYDILTNTYAKKVDFIGSNGSKPEQTQLVEVGSIGTLVKSIDDNKSFNTIYPNPTSSTIIIELNEITRVNVTNTLGQIVLTETMLAGKHELDIQNQANGLYFVKLFQQGKQQTIKLIKK